MVRLTCRTPGCGADLTAPGNRYRSKAKRREYICVACVKRETAEWKKQNKSRVKRHRREEHTRRLKEDQPKLRAKIREVAAKLAWLKSLLDFDDPASVDIFSL